MISFNNCGSRYSLKERNLVRKWLEKVAEEEGNFNIDSVDYVFCSSQYQLELNRQFLGHDYFTDIITFDYSSLKRKKVSGEIYIDVETVRSNAGIYGARFRNEMLRVIVHGVLHLCGQNDKNMCDNVAMHQKEDRYLRLLGTMREER